MKIVVINQYRKQYFNISNVNFINNTGTGLMLEDVTVYFNNITFYNNIGTYGGGMSLHRTTIYLTGPLKFERNTALFGGAIYITGLVQHYIVNTYCNTLEQITFSSNFAGTIGPDVLIEEGNFVNYIIYFTFPCIKGTIPNHAIRGDHIISGPHNITINPQSNSTITLFPGQKLTYSAHVTDYFGNLTSGVIKTFLQCGDYYCEHVQLTGDAQSSISTSNITTNLYLLSAHEHYHTSMKLKLQFSCDTSGTVSYADVNLTTCPLGYVFQMSESILGTCECVDIASDDVQCDFVLGVACIRHDHWFWRN